VMADFYELAEQPYAELEIDFEGDDDREYNFILPPEGARQLCVTCTATMPFSTSGR